MLNQLKFDNSEYDNFEIVFLIWFERFKNVTNDYNRWNASKIFFVWNVFWILNYVNEKILILAKRMKIFKLKNLRECNKQQRMINGSDYAIKIDMNLNTSKM